MNDVYWKNLKKEPPHKNCNICVAVGKTYDTFKYIRFSAVSWGLYKNLRECDPRNIPDHTMYIILDDIKDGL